MAKYPITYAQFQTFLDAADGFSNARWWEGLAASREHRESRVTMVQALEPSARCA